MKNKNLVIADLQNGSYNHILEKLYCCHNDECIIYANRYVDLIKAFDSQFGEHESISLFSAPGRTEISGNHTDHQHGRVLAGSVNMDMIAVVGPNDLNLLRICSEGYGTSTIDLNDLAKKDEEVNTTLALLRGSAFVFSEKCHLSGLDVYISSNVPAGSGLSSSAAFEVLIGTILNETFMIEKVSAVEIAKFGQWVENNYFGKPCGLMDQMACSVGGIVSIDFKNPAIPIVEAVDVDFAKAGLSLCIIDSHASHADLTDEYAAIPSDCKAIAGYFGKEVLRDVEFSAFLSQIKSLRKKFSDRAILRALHFFNEDKRVPLLVNALKQNDFNEFLRLVTLSGNSSYKYLQNVIVSSFVDNQDLALVIGYGETLLAGKGAIRVHGGGFAGTVQAFVPVEMVETFKQGFDTLLPDGSCHILNIRQLGAVKL